jgi:hypothetical protein
MMPGIDDLAERLGGTFEKWFDVVRVVVIFTLGVFLIVYAVVTSGHDIPFIVTGLVLIGLVPIDQFMQRLPRRQQEEDEDARHPFRRHQ